MSNETNDTELTQEERKYMAWYQQVVTGILDYTYSHYGQTLEEVVKKVVKKIGSAKNRATIAWTVWEAKLLGILTADGDYPNLTNIRKTPITDAAKTSAEVALLKQQVEAFKKGIEVAIKAQKEAEQKTADAEKRAAETSAKERVVEVRYHKAGEKVKVTKGIFHEKFPTLLKLAHNRMPIFLYGPTGSGKTFVCKQLADSLGLPFSYISCTAGMSEAHLLGRAVPNLHTGKTVYTPAPLVERAKTGGIFLFDEFCASDPNLLLIVNTMMSNRVLHVPGNPEDPYVELHDDFICIAADNTLGTGGDRMYAGRSKLDLSTVDRFGVGKVFLDYDEVLEAQLCPDEQLRGTLLRYRRAIRAHRLERAMSTRFMAKAYQMLHAEDESMRFTMEEINEAYFQGWREDERNKVLSYNG